MDVQNIPNDLIRTRNRSNDRLKNYTVLQEKKYFSPNLFRLLIDSREKYLAEKGKDHVFNILKIVNFSKTSTDYYFKVDKSKKRFTLFQKDREIMGLAVFI